MSDATMSDAVVLRADQLGGWTIYDHPSDFPNCFIARRWFTERGRVIATADIHTADTLDALRAKLPRGLVPMPRHPDDDPKIVEVWM